MNARDLYEQVKRKSLSIPCEIIRRIENESDNGDLSIIEIVRGNPLTKNCIGIHRCFYESDDQCKRESIIQDAIYVAERDGFERIYVYGGAK